MKNKVIITILLILLLISIGLNIYLLFVKGKINNKSIENEYKYSTSTTFVISRNEGNETGSITAGDVKIDKERFNTCGNTLNSITKDTDLSKKIGYEIDKIKWKLEPVNNTDVLKFTLYSNKAENLANICNEIIRIFSEEMIKTNDNLKIYILDRATDISGIEETQQVFYSSF